MRDSLLDTMLNICQDQIFRNYLLTGFYLTEDQIAEIENTLERNDDFTVAYGEYRGVPVYLATKMKIPEGWANKTIDEVLFTYLVVDINKPSL